MKQVSVSFIGAGNVAWHLAPALDNVGYAVREVYSLHEKNAYALSGRLYQCEPVTGLDFSGSMSRLFVIAVPDDQISGIVKQLRLPQDAVIVHTSGSQPLSVLATSKERTGVFYPLQTFSKVRKLDFQHVPILVESEDAATEKLLYSMGRALSSQVIKCSSQDRKAIHVAAVFASNFTNHMLTLSKEVMVNNKLEFDLLKPLIIETINKSLEIGPENAQTGPAKRGDLEVLDRHMEFLASDAAVSEIYKIVSQHILDTYEPD
jgi:predicted short-subunit dehydrogenase-like oxidoreductase (DUF2520 family)